MAEALPIQEKLAYCTVRIECDHGDGTGSVGTGFVFEFEHKTGGNVPAVVTNRHVLEDAKNVRFHFTAANEDGTPNVGQAVQVVIDPIAGNTMGHPDDSCDLQLIFLAPILVQIALNKQRIFYLHISRSLIPNADRLAQLQAAEDVVMIGYPTGLQDSVNNRPIFRRGITATQPGLNYEGRREFVIDAACYPGSSGSPVFRYVPALNLGAGLTGGAAQLEFLGILWGGPQFSADGTIKVVNIPTKQVPISSTRVPMNLGYVIRAERLIEFDPVISIIPVEPLPGSAT